LSFKGSGPSIPEAGAIINYRRHSAASRSAP
jgi:hypothetical protein